MSELPNGWTIARLDDTCELINGRAYKQSELLERGKYPVLRVGNFFSNRSWYYSDLELEEDKYCDDGDLLYAWSASFGPRIWDGGKAIFHYHIWNTRLNKQAVDKRFLYHWFEWDKENIKSDHGTGSTMIHVTKGDMEARSFNLPPLPEQQRIVAKVDSLTGKSRRARDHIDHVPRLVEKYKQAVLAAAFSGELIGLKAAETVLLHDRCWNLPRSWHWVHFSEVVEIASNLEKPEKIPNLPHIAPDNVESGTGRLLPFRTIREDEVISPKHRFFAGQVIYSKIRPYLRKAVLVDFEGACSADMYPLTVTGKLDPAFLLYWLISEPFAGFTVEHEGRTVLPKINQQGLNQTPLPLPPLTDQHELVRHLRSAFTWIDRLASEATSVRRLIDRLGQAVLAKAFRGELVPQDPADEPASVLLERIRAERGTAPKRKNRRPVAPVSL
jgi:type I restriction enzyme S subunit